MIPSVINEMAEPEKTAAIMVYNYPAAGVVANTAIRNKNNIDLFQSPDTVGVWKVKHKSHAKAA